jgi:hypothetical protein
MEAAASRDQKKKEVNITMVKVRGFEDNVTTVLVAEYALVEIRHVIG